MPRYDFECRTCQIRFEERRPFAQADLPAECPLCHEFDTTKIIAAVPVFASTRHTSLEPMSGGLELVRRTGHGTGCPCCG